MNVDTLAYHHKNREIPTSVLAAIYKRFFPSIKFADWPQLLCVLYITIWVISPPLMIDPAYRVPAVCAAILWLLIEFFRHPRTFFAPSRATGCAFIFIAYSSIVNYTTRGAEGIISSLQLYIFLLFMLFYESYRKRDIRQLRIVFWSALFIFPVWLLTTLSAYQNMPDASRLLVREGALQTELALHGIGGYELVYAVLITIPIVLYLLKARTFSKLTTRLVLFANLVLNYLLITRAGYSIAVILMVVGTIVVLIVTRLNQKTLLKAILFSMLLLALLPVLLPGFLRWMSVTTQNTMYEQKYQDIVTSLTQAESVGTLYGRFERYSVSVRLFIEHPFIGTFNSSGGHSSILDHFARYGVIIGYIFAYLVFYLPLRYLKDHRNSMAFGMTLAIACIVIAFSFTDNLTAESGFIIFIFYPIAMSYIDEKAQSCITP